MPSDGHSAKQVEHLLAEAESTHAQRATDRDPVWTSRYEEAELNAEGGNCWRLLGDHTRAVNYAEAAVTAFRSSCRRECPKAGGRGQAKAPSRTQWAVRPERPLVVVWS